MTNDNRIIISRTTKETTISGALLLGGGDDNSISTGIGFFDHMLNTLAMWAGWSLTLKCVGDLEIDTHHTVEDVGLALGEALLHALEPRSPLMRVASSMIPMDEALSRAVIDVCGRPYCVYRAPITVERIGQFETIMTGHFFRSFATSSKLTLHIENLYGEDPHHQVESMFKAVGAALLIATQPRQAGLLSTKGSL